MSYTIRVKIPSGELELQGPRSDLNKAIDDLPDILHGVRKAFSVPVLPAVGTENTPETSGPFIDRPAGLNDAIVKVLSTGWGTMPRKWAEIDQVLKQNALNYSRGSVTSALAYLVRSGRLRRVPIDGVYGYQVPLRTLPVTAPLRGDSTAEPEVIANESRVSGSRHRGKAETSVILQEISSKMMPLGFFDEGRTTREVKEELERTIRMRFQSRKVSQALGTMYDKGELRRTGTRGDFTYIINR